MAEFKGVSQSIPNEGILIDTLSLQEAKDSSAIENIITTHDALFKEVIEKNRAGFRKVPGTALYNDATGQLVYTPPQHPDHIVTLTTGLERFINDETPTVGQIQTITWFPRSIASPGH